MRFLSFCSGLIVSLSLLTLACRPCPEVTDNPLVSGIFVLNPDLGGSDIHPADDGHI